MADPLHKDSEHAEDIRMTTTTKIWSYAIGMLALCIPLSPITRSGVILPLAVVTSAAAGTAFVWRSDKKAQNALPTSELQQIEERLANLETIAASGQLELRSQFKQLESNNQNVSE